MIGASGPGNSSLASQKFAANTSKSHSQVRPGGIFGSPGPFSAPGRVGAGGSGTCLTGVESLLRPFSCPAKYMIISFGVPLDAPRLKGG